VNRSRERELLLARAEDRALLGSNPSADPGAKTGAGIGGRPPVPLPITPAPGLAWKRQTLAARRREIRHRMSRHSLAPAGENSGSR